MENVPAILDVAASDPGGPSRGDLVHGFQDAGYDIDQDPSEQ